MSISRRCPKQGRTDTSSLALTNSANGGASTPEIDDVGAHIFCGFSEQMIPPPEWRLLSEAERGGVLVTAAVKSMSVVDTKSGVRACAAHRARQDKEKRESGMVAEPFSGLSASAFACAGDEIFASIVGSLECIRDVDGRT